MPVNGTQTSFYYDIGFDEPYLLASSAASSLVPGYAQIAIGGKAYQVETSFTPFKQDAYRSDSIAPVADKTDISNIPGAGSVSTEGLWRRGMEDFSKGSGQLFLDRRDSADSRFYQSKGIYPWTQWQATLLNDTTQVHGSGLEYQVLVVGSYVYINDNGTVRYATGNLSSWTAVSGVTASTNNCALATDGNNVYIACGANGIYIITTPGSTASSWVTTSSATITNVWYAGGQLLAAGTVSSVPTLFNIWLATSASATAYTSAGPAAGTSVLFQPTNKAFTFTSCAAGNSWIYVGGATSNTSANFSVVYKVQMNTTGTALTAPVTAATLPGGELVYALFAYSNFILVGTSLGARFCETLGINDPGGNAGDLKMGPIVPDQVQQVSRPVKAFTGQFRWVWFSWSNYDAVSTGLGRMDLSTFIDQQAPAYTSDLMVTGAGDVVSMDWYNGLNNVSGVNTGSPVFVVNGLGVYTAASTYVASGTIDSGLVTYGLPDQKLARLFDFNAIGTTPSAPIIHGISAASPGTLSGQITVDSGNASYSISAQPLSSALQEISLPTSLKGELFDIQVTLNAGATVNQPTVYTTTPILTRWQMKSLPCVISATVYKVIINLFYDEQTGGIDQHYDPYVEFAYLDGLRQSVTPVQYQEGTGLNVTVVVKSITRLPYSLRNTAEGGFNFRFEIELQSLED